MVRSKNNKIRYVAYVVRSSLCLNCARIIVCMYAWHFIKLALLQRSHPLLPLASDTSLSRLMRCDKSRKQTRLKKKFVKNKSNGNKQQGSARVSYQRGLLEPDIIDDNSLRLPLLGVDFSAPFQSFSHGFIYC